MSNQFIKIPNVLPTTNSWIYMPLLLSPFETIKFKLDDEIIDIVNIELDHLDIKIHINDILSKIRDYYIKSNINLSDYKNIENIKINDCQIRLDGCLHIPGKQQEILLDEIFGEDNFIRDILPVLIIKNKITVS